MTSTEPAGGFLYREPGAADEFRLFCFHHAGGGASAFRGWRELLAPAVSVYPVQLAGREGRVSEPRQRDIRTLVADLDTWLGPYVDRPFAFYGHSMGALIAYRLTRALVARGGPRPVSLLVGAYPGPHQRAPLEQMDGLSDAHMLDMLIDAGGLSETVRGFPKWTTAMVALLRDDLALCRSHQPGDCARLPVPIHVFTGDADPMMSAADAEQWAGHSSIGYRSHVIPGGHFFNRESRPLLISAITAILFGQPITPS